MKERKHKWGKRNKARIAAGLPPVTQQTPLHTARFYRSERPAGCKPPQTPSVVMIQAGVIEELSARVTALEDAFRSMGPLRPTVNLKYTRNAKEKK